MRVSCRHCSQWIDEPSPGCKVHSFIEANVTFHHGNTKDDDLTSLVEVQRQVLENLKPVQRELKKQIVSMRKARKAEDRQEGLQRLTKLLLEAARATQSATQSIVQLKKNELDMIGSMSQDETKDLLAKTIRSWPYKMRFDAILKVLDDWKKDHGIDFASGLSPN